MSKFAEFMKKNKKVRPNVKYRATKSLCDADGQPLEWEIQPITSARNEAIRRECSKNGELDFSKYKIRMVCECVVVPDLTNAELQDSYGAGSEEELVYAMVDDFREFDALVNFVFSAGDTEDIGKITEEAKN
jgi:hypothetical protein